MPAAILGRHEPDAGAQACVARADRWLVRLAFAASLLLLALVAPTASAEAAETRIIVKRDAGLSAAERADIRADAGVRLVKTLRIANAEVVTTSDPKGALAQLRGDPDVRYAEIDRVRHAFVSDADFDLQWALSNDGGNLQRNFVGGPAGTPDADMDVPEAWDRGAKGAGVKVGVVDS